MRLRKIRFQNDNYNYREVKMKISKMALQRIIRTKLREGMFDRITSLFSTGGKKYNLSIFVNTQRLSKPAGMYKTSLDTYTPDFISALHMMIKNHTSEFIAAASIQNLFLTNFRLAPKAQDDTQIILQLDSSQASAFKQNNPDLITALNQSYNKNSSSIERSKSEGIDPLPILPLAFRTQKNSVYNILKNMEVVIEGQKTNGLSALMYYVSQTSQSSQLEFGTGTYFSGSIANSPYLRPLKLTLLNTFVVPSYDFVRP